VGVSIGALVLAALVGAVLFARRRKSRGQYSAQLQNHNDGAEKGDGYVETDGHKRHISELSSEAVTPELASGLWPVEADSRAVPSELDGNNDR
jgi:hypothetical protein